MCEAALEIRGLRRSFSRFQLGPIDLTVPRGAIYGFVGPNGAGKTTTIDLIFGMGMKNAGSIRVLGYDHLKDELEMKRRVAYVGPDLDYRQWGRVGRVIQFVRGFYPSWDDAYCDRLLETFRLRSDERILTLSFGARIKLALVLALSWRPQLLILDEPTVGLDAISKRDVFGELLAAVRDGERAVFISSHAIADLERFADHVAMIKDGGILFEGATADVVERYRMVELIAGAGVDVGAQPGVYVQDRDQDRWRVLVDTQHVPPTLLGAHGVQTIADTPVALEDLFVALGH